MAKKMSMSGDVCSCGHHKWFGWLALVVGALYLLQDLSVISWFSWLNWYTALFILIGLGAVCKCCDCGKWF